MSLAYFIRLLAENYSKNDIYSLVGKVLIAINPFEKLSDLFSETLIKQYYVNIANKNPPHLYSIANEAIKELRLLNKSQSIILLGESGSGKTESTKEILRYLCYFTNNDVAHKINHANPIMEAFGNAKTLWNDNSSRYCKFIELHYDSSFEIIGGQIKNFMLEKSRIIDKGYHIFRIIFGSPAHINKSLKFDEEHSGDATVEYDIVAEFERFDEALSQFNIIPEQRIILYRIIAGILHLSKVDFEDNDPTCSISKSSDESVQIASQLLSIDSNDLVQNLTTKQLKISNRAGEVADEIQLPVSAASAQQMRNTLIKCLFISIRNKIICAINGIVGCVHSELFIGVLDMPGFERFDSNSLEQLLINYVNEEIHKFSMERLINTTEEYIDNLENSPAIALIGSKVGILSLLDDESKLQQPSAEQFTLKVYNTWESNDVLTQTPKRVKFEGFTIRHFVTNVHYETKSFVQKNTEAITNSIFLLSKKISNKFLYVEDTQLNKMDRFKSECSDFKKQLNNLFETLKKSNTSFIRCLKPNRQNLTKSFDIHYIEEQCRNTGTATLIQNANIVVKLGETTMGFSIEELQVKMSKKAQQPENSVEVEAEQVVDNYAGIDHLPEFDNNKSSTRCSRCKKTTHVTCAKCKVNLCFVRTRNCFKEYHTQGSNKMKKIE